MANFSDVIANLYQTVLEVNLIDLSLLVINIDEESSQSLDIKDASSLADSLINKFVAPEYKEQLSRLFKYEKYSETYKIQKLNELEVKTFDKVWRRISIIPGTYNENGVLENAFICIQNINSVKSSEEKHNEMISAMSHVFDALFFVDLKTKRMGIVNVSDGFYEPKGRISDAKESFEEYIKNHVRDDYATEMTSFFDIDSISRRLENRDVVSYEYRGNNNNWYWAQFICAARNAGECTDVLLGVRNISEDKKKNTTKDSIIRTLTDDYQNIFIGSLETGLVDIFRLDDEYIRKYGKALQTKEYNKIASYYINEVVYEDDRDLFLDVSTVQAIKECLKNHMNYKITYRVKSDRVINNYKVRFEMSNESDENFIVAFKNIDDEITLQNEVKRGHDAYVTLHKLIKSGMWSQYYDDEGNASKLYWSDEFRKMLGYESEDDFPNKMESFLDILDDEDRERVATTIRASIHDYSGNTLYDDTFRVKTKNRGYRWFRATGDCSRNSNGYPICFYGVFLDVTDEHERDALEKERISALNEAQAYLESMNAIHGVINSGKWTISFDEYGKYTSVIWGQDFRNMLGYESEEEFPNSGQSLLKIIHDDDYDKAIAFFRESFDDCRNDFIYNNDFRLLTKSNGYCWFQAVAKISFDERGVPKTVYGILFNIDEKKKNEELIEEQNRIVDVLSRDYTEIRLLDLTLDQAQIIKSKGKMLGMLRPETHSYSESWKNVIEEYAFPEDVYDISDCVSADRVLRELEYKDEYSYNFRVNYNGEHHYQVIFVKLNNQSGCKNIIVSGIRSIDNIIATEKEQKKLLQNALTAAERANRAKTVFLNSMSHDIRTPMNAIVGFASLASTHIDNKDQVRDYLEKIKVSSSHLLSLINDVLDMSRIESGKVKIDAKEINLPEALHDIRSIIQSDIASKKLQLQIDCLDVVNENIICDKLRLNQVLLNLVSNSIKFTPPEGTISIKVIQKHGMVADKAYFEFIVKDTGIGMSPEFLEHIFEPFSREETSTVSGIQGTGLGMAITKNIIDMMKGSITVTSKQNEGTEFRIELSFDVCDGPISTEPIESLKDASVLIVDDDIDSCQALSKMISSLGLKPEWTTSGYDAVRKAEDAISEGRGYKVYILDWLIPDMNGLDIVKRLKSKLPEDAIVIVMTSYDWTDVEKEGYDAGITAFCSKPVFLSDLRSLLVNRSRVRKVDDDGESMDFNGRRILIVEDNELNREIAVGILETVGFETETAADGNIAVDMVKKSQEGYYDIILMDIQMPTMNGYEATKLIRKLENESLRNIPIIAMTANAFEEDRKKALSVGMNNHVAKPFETKMLFKTLRNYLK